jgi:hypothetical protein
MDNEELFNSAISDEPIEPVTAEPVIEPEAQPRDDHGRFAQKEPETVAAKPEPQGKDEAHVPSWRLREVREEADRRIAEAEARWQRQIEQLQRQNQPKPEPAKVPDVFEDPNGFLQHGVSQAIDPIKSEVQQTREYFSRMMAEEKHGPEKVQAAYDWIKQGMDRGDPEAVTAYQRAMRSMHPYGELIKAHQQQSVYQQIGSDPNAWFEKELEKRLSDPQFAAAQLQKIQNSVRDPQAQGIVKLPPSVGRIASSKAASEDAGDMSDASLFAHAMR